MGSRGDRQGWVLKGSRAGEGPAGACGSEPRASLVVRDQTGEADNSGMETRRPGAFPSEGATVPLIDEILAIASSMPEWRPSVVVHKGTAADLIAELRKAGVMEDVAPPGSPFGPMDGLMIEEIPLLGITVVGTPEDIEALKRSPADLGHVLAVANGKVNPNRARSP